MSERARQELISRARERMERQGRRGLRRVPPRPRRPEQQIRQYRASLRRVTGAIEEEVRERVFPEIEELLKEAGTRDDAIREDAWGKRLRELFESVFRSIESAIKRAKEAMQGFGDEVEKRATDEVMRAIHATMGVNPSFYDEDRIRGILNAWKEQNDAFITRMAREEIDQMMDVASRAVRQGRPTKEVKDELRKRFGISDRRARLIARTEISQLNSQITKSRQKEIGVRKYTWVSSRDERVRKSHEDLDGREFDWDDPPPEGHPGDEPNCRCVARPSVKRLIEELEAE